MDATERSGDINVDLLLALVEAAGERAVQPMADLLRAAATVLACKPGLAATWGRILTDAASSAPLGQGRRDTPVHPFMPASPHRIVCLAPASYGAAGVCGAPEDASVHRTEELSDRQAYLLSNFVEHGQLKAPEALVGLGLVDREFGSEFFTITSRGRAWLEAHPREAGEPS